MNIDKTIENLIIGAGLSGLSFAYFNKRDDYLIIEKDNTPGGYCRTIPNNTYVWDYAGHFYHFRKDKYKRLFESLVDESEIIRQNKETKIYYKGKLIDYPFQTNIHQLDKEEFIECLYDLFVKDQNLAYRDFLEMLYAKFGRSITEKFLRPYNEKLYATDLKKLDKDAMGRFFPYADIEAIIRNMKEKRTKTYNDEFLYIKKGTGVFVDRLFEKINRDKVLFDTSVVEIDIHRKIVITSNGQTIRYKNLINTMPFNQFLKFSNINNELYQNLSYNKVLVLNLGFNKNLPKSSDYMGQHWVYFPDKNLNFYRIGFYSNILNSNKLNVYVEIGFSKDQDINIEKELDDTLEGMKRVGILDEKNSLADKSIIVMDPAYVHISTKEDLEVQKLQKNLEEYGVYNLGRYGKWTYNSMEDCMSLADDLAQRL